MKIVTAETSLLLWTATIPLSGHGFQVTNRCPLLSLKSPLAAESIITEIALEDDEFVDVEAEPQTILEEDADKRKPIYLNSGSPDFGVPGELKKAISEAADNTKKLGYPPQEGEKALRRAIASFAHNKLSLPNDENIVTVTHGAMQGVYISVVEAIRDRGPNPIVLIPDPYWFQLRRIVVQAGGKPVVIRTERYGSKLTPGALDQALRSNDNVAAVLFTNPNNPNGIEYNSTELGILASVILLYNRQPRNKKVMVISDEVYNFLRIDDPELTKPPATSIRTVSGMEPLTFTINSFSKNQGLAGLRVGYVIAPTGTGNDDNLLNGMRNSLRFTSNGVNTFTQAGALAIASSDEFIKRVNRCLQPYLQSAVKKWETTHLLKDYAPLPETLPTFGTYLWVNCSRIIASSPEIHNITHFNQLLNTSQQVTIAPGSDFGREGFARITYPMEEFDEGIDRIDCFLHEMGFRPWR